MKSIFRKMLNRMVNDYDFVIGDSLSEKEYISTAVLGKRSAMFDEENQELLTDFKYKTIFPEKNGLCRFITLRNNYGYLDLQGNEVIKLKKYKGYIKESFDFDYYGIAKVVSTDNKFGLINKKGKIIADAIYDTINLMGKVESDGSISKRYEGIKDGESVLLYIVVDKREKVINQVKELDEILREDENLC